MVGYMCKPSHIRKHQQHINTHSSWLSHVWLSWGGEEITHVWDQDPCTVCVIYLTYQLILFPHCDPLWSISCFLPSPVNSWWSLWTPSCQKLQSCTPQGSPPPSPLPPLVYTYLVSAPRPWQQLVLRFGWELITPWWSPAKSRGGFF